MMDLLEETLFRYYRDTHWDPANAYPHLNRISKAVLGFHPPQHPFHFALSKSISSQLKASYGIGLPQVRSVSFLFTSVRASSTGGADTSPEAVIPPSRVHADLHATLNTPRWDLDEAQRGKCQEEHPFLLYGRLSDSGTLEGTWTRRHGPHWQTVLSGISSLSRAYPSQLHVQVQAQRQQWSHELSYSSSGNMLGASTLYHIPNSGWSLGSELYYTINETSGGLSFGARYQDVLSRSGGGDLADLCLLANPAMGHLSLSHSISAMQRQLLLSARYDFNVYSYHSDLSFGLIYAPSQKQQTIKFRVGLEQDLALVWEAQVGQAAVLSVGVMTELLPGASTAPSSASQLHRSFGVELSMEIS